MASFWTDLSTGVTNTLGVAGEVVSAIFTSDGELAPLMGFIFIGLSVSFVLLGIKIVKSLVYGI